MSSHALVLIDNQDTQKQQKQLKEFNDRQKELFWEDLRQIYQEWLNEDPFRDRNNFKNWTSEIKETPAEDNDYGPGRAWLKSHSTWQFGAIAALEDNADIYEKDGRLNKRYNNAMYKERWSSLTSKAWGTPNMSRNIRTNYEGDGPTFTITALRDEGTSRKIIQLLITHPNLEIENNNQLARIDGVKWEAALTAEIEIARNKSDLSDLVRVASIARQTTGATFTDTAGSGRLNRFWASSNKRAVRDLTGPITTAETEIAEYLTDPPRKINDNESGREALAEYLVKNQEALKDKDDFKGVYDQLKDYKNVDINTELEKYYQSDQEKKRISDLPITTEADKLVKILMSNEVKAKIELAGKVATALGQALTDPQTKAEIDTNVEIHDIAARKATANAAAQQAGAAAPGPAQPTEQEISDRYPDAKKAHAVDPNTSAQAFDDNVQIYDIIEAKVGTGTAPTPAEINTHKANAKKAHAVDPNTSAQAFDDNVQIYNIIEAKVGQAPNAQDILTHKANATKAHAVDPATSAQAFDDNVQIYDIIEAKVGQAPNAQDMLTHKANAKKAHAVGPASSTLWDSDSDTFGSATSHSPLVTIGLSASGQPPSPTTTGNPPAGQPTGGGHPSAEA